MFEELKDAIALLMIHLEKVESQIILPNNELENFAKLYVTT